ncbi:MULTISPECIES: cation diffusion facilitator family transporter [Sphingomonas]|uniref:cation diffusion facilitator family transporter n=1 Tax=Sphingomonas TaxID=13687 RepID=UPI000B101692
MSAPTHHDDRAARQAEVGAITQRAAIASVATATVLLGVKGWAAFHTGSVALLASLADSGLDLIASLTTLFGVRLAAQPADHDHRFGHGKAEALVALVQVALIAASAFAICWRAVEQLMGAQPIEDIRFGIGASMVAMLATVLLIAYQRHVIARTGSVAIKTDRMHYESDLMINAAVVIALVLEAQLGLNGADALFGIGIAIWLLWGAWRGSTEAINQLMDKEWPEAKRRRFVEVASRHPELKGLHDLRTRTSGATDFVQFHMWMDPKMTVAEAHDVVEDIERRLALEFPGTEILIHIDPEGKVDHPGNPLVEADEIAKLRSTAA